MSARKMTRKKLPETDFEKALRDKLRKVRVQRDMSTLEVAFKMECSQATVSRIECGKQAIQLSYLVRFAQLLRLDTDFFLRNQAEIPELNAAEEEKIIEELLQFFKDLQKKSSLLNPASPAYELIIDLHRHLKSHDLVAFTVDPYPEEQDETRTELEGKQN